MTTYVSFACTPSDVTVYNYNTINTCFISTNHFLLHDQIYSNSSMSVPAVFDDPGILDVNCWPTWPLWECYGANIAGLCSTAVWFIVLLPQVIKNFWRKSVSGLSFLWAVANFTASLVNLFFNFSVQLPFYKRVSAVYMPVLELTILGQFMLYSKCPVTTRLLALLVCLIMWGGIIELELNLPESTDKLQWIAVTLWSIETFPQVELAQIIDNSVYTVFLEYFYMIYVFWQTATKYILDNGLFNFTLLYNENFVIKSI